MLVRLLPEAPEARGLLALLLFAEARGETRLGPAGDLVLLANQIGAVGAAPSCMRDLPSPRRRCVGGTVASHSKPPSRVCT